MEHSRKAHHLGITLVLALIALIIVFTPTIGRVRRTTRRPTLTYTPPPGTEQSQTEQSQTEQSQTEQSQTEQSQIEQPQTTEEDEKISDDEAKAAEIKAEEPTYRATPERRGVGPEPGPVKQPEDTSRQEGLLTRVGRGVVRAARNAYEYTRNLFTSRTPRRMQPRRPSGRRR